MQVNLQSLSRQAIDSALEKDWEKAIEINKAILEKDPDNKNAKTRLGRAYIKTENFSEAKKIYKEILEKDPINTIALKNYKLATQNNSDKKNEKLTNHTAKNLIKEPGTTAQINIPAHEKILSKLEPGQEIRLRSYKTKLSFYLDKKQELGYIKDYTARAVYKAKKDGLAITAAVIKPNKDHLSVLLKCKQPIFRSEKQQEKPYMKTTLIDEPAIEMKTLEEDEES